jgi:hypothetical protein
LKVELYDKHVFVGLTFPRFTENHEQKKSYLPNGELVAIKTPKEVKVRPLDSAANQIIRQLKNRRFLGLSSFQGRLIYTTYRLFPSISIDLDMRRRRKIMKV